MKDSQTAKSRYFKRTEDGESVLSGILAVMITMIFMLVLLFAFIFWQKQISLYDDAQWCARSCVMEMMSSGYLSDSLKSELRNELSALGMSDISFAGSTDTAVGYGKPVVLKISGRFRIDSVGWSGPDVFSFFKDSLSWNVNIEKADTCIR